MLRGWVVFSNLWFSIGRRTLSVAASRLPFLGLHRALGGTCRVTVLSVAYLGQLLGCLLAAKELLSQDSYPILFRIVPRRCLGGRGHLMHRTILVHIPLLQKYSLCDGIEAVYLSCFHSLLLLFMLRPLSDLCRACVCVCGLVAEYPSPPWFCSVLTYSLAPGISSLRRLLGRKPSFTMPRNMRHQA